ncbi:MAG: hypothetical protein ACYSWU_00375 [Planctomycetota bacterium]|jgi:protein-arginine kinase activator protein McsA
MNVINAGRKGRPYLCPRCNKEKALERLRSAVHKPRYKDITGQRFDYLVVMAKTNRQQKNGDRSPEYLWKVRCTKCGRIVYRTYAHLKLARSCGCLRRRAGKAHPLSKYVGQVPGTFFAGWRVQAKRENKAVRVSNKELADLFEQQEGRCALTGVELSFGSPTLGEEATVSIDRIDSTERVYRLENVQWVHKAVQQIKWTLPEDRLICFCQLVTKPIRSKEPSYACVATRKHKNFGGEGNIGRDFWGNSMRAADDTEKRKKLPRCRRITIKQGWKKFLRQKGRCALTGLELDFHQATGRTKVLPGGSRRSIPYRGSASLDRIDSSRGHSNENTQWVHKHVQRMKWDLDEKEFKKWCRRLAKRFRKSTPQAAQIILADDRKDMPSNKQTCRYCTKKFEALTPWAKWCSGPCKAAAYRKEKR